MKTMNAGIAASMERLRLETGSDFAGLGLIDRPSRRLRWRIAAGSISERTLLMEQKLTAGISGTAIRSGRPACTTADMTDAERFRLGEPVMLGEQLRIAASVPIEWEEGISGVLLLGRRSGANYGIVELECATRATKELMIWH
jgi:nitrogen regulatory protein A